MDEGESIEKRDRMVAVTLRQSWMMMVGRRQQLVRTCHVEYDEAEYDFESAWLSVVDAVVYRCECCMV